MLHELSSDNGGGNGPARSNMCRLASGRHLRSLVIVPSLLVMLAFPASAQTNSDPWIKRLRQRP